MSGDGSTGRPLADLYHAARAAKATPPVAWPAPELARWGAATLAAVRVASGDAATAQLRWTHWLRLTTPADGAARHGTWADLCAWLREQGARRVAAKGEAAPWAPAAFDDGKRSNDAVRALYCLALDCDDGGDWPELLAALAGVGLAYLAHRSPSHRDNGGPCKWRLVLPLAAKFQMTAEQAQYLWRDGYHAARLALGAVGRCWFDPACADPCRAWLPPVAVGDAAPREVRVFDGAALDFAALLRSRPPALTPTLSGPAVRREVAQPDKVRRAEAWVQRRPPAVQGQGGDAHTFATAAKLARGFDLSDAEALPLLQAWNSTCQPPWPDPDLRKKLANARKHGSEGPGAALNAPLAATLRGGPAPAQATPRRGVAGEARALWQRCAPVTADPAVSAWLADAGCDAAAVAALDLARALPADLPDLPAWAKFKGQPWTATGHRLLARAWEADPDNPGRLRWASVCACSVLPGPNDDDRGEAWPTGTTPGGLVLAPWGDPSAHGRRHLDLAAGVAGWLRLLLSRGAQCPKGKRPAVWGRCQREADSGAVELVPAGWPVLVHPRTDGRDDGHAWAGALAACGFQVWLARDDAALACKGLRLATSAAELARVWWVCRDAWPGPAGVPVHVRRLHAELRAELPPCELDAYLAQMGELVLA